MLELGLCPGLLPVDEPERHVLVQLVEEDDDQEVEGGGHQGGQQPGLGEQNSLGLLVLLEGFPGNISLSLRDQLDIRSPTCRRS